jgi:hypothetical protein
VRLHLHLLRACRHRGCLCVLITCAQHSRWVVMQLHIIVGQEVLPCTLLQQQAGFKPLKAHPQRQSSASLRSGDSYKRIRIGDKRPTYTVRLHMCCRQPSTRDLANSQPSDGRSFTCMPPFWWPGVDALDNTTK